MRKKDGLLRAKVGKEDQLVPPVQGWQFKDGTKWSSEETLECSREVEEEIIRREVERIKKEKEEKRRRKIALAREEEERRKREEEKRRREEEERRKKEEEEARRKEQPLAAQVDAAAKEGDLAHVKELQKMDTSGDLSLSF